VNTTTLGEIVELQWKPILKNRTEQNRTEQKRDKRKMNEIKKLSESSKSASEYNIKLDEYLRTTPEITEELFVALDEAYGYDAATTISWAISKLRILRTRLINKEEIKLTDKEPLKTEEDLKQLVKTRYPSISDDIFKDNY